MLGFLISAAVLVQAQATPQTTPDLPFEATKPPAISKLDEQMWLSILLGKAEALLRKEWNAAELTEKLIPLSIEISLHDETAICELATRFYDSLPEKDRRQRSDVLWVLMMTMLKYGEPRAGNNGLHIYEKEGNFVVQGNWSMFVQYTGPPDRNPFAKRPQYMSWYKELRESLGIRDLRKFQPQMLSNRQRFDLWQRFKNEG